MLKDEIYDEFKKVKELKEEDEKERQHELQQKE